MTTASTSAFWSNLEAIDKAHQIIRDVANKRTYIVLHLIKKYQPIRVMELKMRAQDMLEIAEIHRDVISQDLMSLREHELVIGTPGENDARRMYYSLNQSKYDQVTKFCEDLTEGMENVNVGPGMIVS